MNKKQLLKHLQKDIYCRIGISKIQGIGVIAIRSIPKGIDPFKGSWNGRHYRFKTSEFKKIPQPVIKMLKAFGSIHNDVVYVPSIGLNRIDISFFLNHSKNANVRALEKGEHFLTIRAIKKGDELTVDYDTFSDDYKDS